MVQGAVRKRLAPAQRRAEIISAAHRVLDGRDPNSVTFEEIAAAAGVSRALVYSYFGDRGGLLAEVYVELMAALDLEWEQILSGQRSPHDRVVSLISASVNFAVDHPERWRTVALLAANTHPDLVRARSARYERLGESWGSGPAGVIRVSALAGLLEASVLEWLGHREVSVETLTATLADLVWFGVAPLLAPTTATGLEPT